MSDPRLLSVGPAAWSVWAWIGGGAPSAGLHGGARARARAAPACAHLQSPRTRGARPWQRRPRSRRPGGASCRRERRRPAPRRSLRRRLPRPRRHRARRRPPPASTCAHREERERAARARRQPEPVRRVRKLPPRLVRAESTSTGRRASASAAAPGRRRRRRRGAAARKRTRGSPAQWPCKGRAGPRAARVRGEPVERQARVIANARTPSVATSRAPSVAHASRNGTSSSYCCRESRPRPASRRRRRDPGRRLGGRQRHGDDGAMPALSTRRRRPARPSAAGTCSSRRRRAGGRASRAPSRAPTGRAGRSACCARAAR